METMTQRKQFIALYRQHVQQEHAALGYMQPPPAAAPPAAPPPTLRFAGLAALALALGGLALAQIG